MDAPLDVCTACGSFMPHVANELEIKEQNLRDLEKSLRIERSKVSRALGEQRRQRVLDPLRLDGEEVFRYWKVKIAPNAREFTGERFDNVVARLRAGHTVEDLKKAIDGAAARPREGTTTDLLTICRNEPNLLMFMNWAKTATPATHAVDPKLEKAYAEYRKAFVRPMVDRVAQLRGWKAEVIWELGLGFDPQARRVVFPIRDAGGVLIGFSRWQPNKERRGNSPKNMAEGQRELWPPPEMLEAESIWLVEGEPDAVSMACIGFPATSLPGVATWKEGWEKRFERFERVRICLDADEKGRECAAKRQAAISKVTEVSVVDLAPGREDGYDVNDLLVDRKETAPTELARLSTGSMTVLRLQGRSSQPAEPLDGRRPIERVIEALERSDCRVRGQEPQMTAQCPCHDDRAPSMSLAVGDDDRVLFTCHAGCEPSAIVEAMGLTWKDVFAAA